MSTDPQGNVYVTEDANAHWTWGTDSLADPPFHNPTAIAPDTDHDQLFVVNQQSHMA